MRHHLLTLFVFLCLRIAWKSMEWCSLWRILTWLKRKVSRAPVPRKDSASFGSSGECYCSNFSMLARSIWPGRKENPDVSIFFLCRRVFGRPVDQALFVCHHDAVPQDFSEIAFRLMCKSDWRLRYTRCTPSWPVFIWYWERTSFPTVSCFVFFSLKFDVGRRAGFVTGFALINKPNFVPCAHLHILNETRHIHSLKSMDSKWTCRGCPSGTLILPNWRTCQYPVLFLDTCDQYEN